jgi:hypothetical protein
MFSSSPFFCAYVLVLFKQEQSPAQIRCLLQANPDVTPTSSSSIHRHWPMAFTTAQPGKTPASAADGRQNGRIPGLFF